MTTLQDLYTRARAAGLDDATALAEARLQAPLAMSQNIVAPLPPAPAPAEPQHDWSRYDAIDARGARAMDAAMDPQRAAARAQERAALERERDALLEQARRVLQPIDARIRAINTRLSAL